MCVCERVYVYGERGRGSGDIKGWGEEGASVHLRACLCLHACVNRFCHTREFVSCETASVTAPQRMHTVSHPYSPIDAAEMIDSAPGHQSIETVEG